MAKFIFSGVFTKQTEQTETRLLGAFCIKLVFFSKKDEFISSFFVIECIVCNITIIHKNNETGLERTQLKQLPVDVAAVPRREIARDLSPYKQRVGVRKRSVLRTKTVGKLTLSLIKQKKSDFYLHSLLRHSERVSHEVKNLADRRNTCTRKTSLSRLFSL